MNEVTTDLPRWFSLPCLVTAFAIGLWGRFNALGSRQLAIDEYYLLVSIEALLNSGLPEPPGGGLYTRGLPLQFLAAGFIRLVGDSHLGLRLTTVLLGLAVAVAAYFLGRRVAGNWLGAALASALLISSWHIEFSRFGRMYVDLQLFTLLLVLSLMDVMQGARGFRRILPFVWVTLAVLTHELGIALVPLLLVPVLHRWARDGLPPARQLLAPSLVAFLLLLVWAVDLRTFGVLTPYPEGYQAVGGGPALSLPAFPFWSAGTPFRSLGLVLLLMGTGAAIGFRVDRRRSGGPPILHLALPMVVAASLHQFMLAGFLALALAFRPAGEGNDRVPRRSLGWLLATAGLCLGWVGYAAWVTWGAGDRSWLDAADAGSFLGGGRAVFVGWPEWVRSLFFVWFYAVPTLTVVLVAATAVQLIAWLRAPLDEMLRHPFLPVLWILVFFGTFSAAYPTTRYSFFLYPLLLLLFFLSVRDVLSVLPVGKWIRARPPLAAMAPFTAGILVFLATEDVNPSHVRHVASPEVAFRTGGFTGWDEMWYEREDYRGPAEFVNAAAGPGDGILVVDAPPASYYVERVHAVYLHREGHRFRNVSRARGTVDYWSGQRLLSTPTELQTWSADLTRIWVIGWVEGLAPGLELEVALGGRLRGIHPVFQSRDDRLHVLRVELADSGGTAVSPGAGTPLAEDR